MIIAILVRYIDHLPNGYCNINKIYTMFLKWLLHFNKIYRRSL